MINQPTVKGNALANASFGKPISRATATRLLGQVIERARAYNADPVRLLTVTEIVLFGSYLDSAVDLLGDLDLAVRRCSGIQTESGTWKGLGVRQSQRVQLQRVP